MGATGYSIGDDMRLARKAELVRPYQPVPCVSTNIEHTDRGSGDDVANHLDHSSPAIEPTSPVRHVLETRSVRHLVATESHDGRVFDPCTPVRAGPNHI
jgi:hypothetical protein